MSERIRSIQQLGFFLETLLASAQQDATAAAPLASGFGRADTLRAQIVVTAKEGTSPTLDVLIEDTLDGTNWNTIGTFAQLTDTGQEAINITAPFSENIRVSWTIGGTATPKFTFEVIVHASRGAR